MLTSRSAHVYSTFDDVASPPPREGGKGKILFIAGVSAAIGIAVGFGAATMTKNDQRSVILTTDLLAMDFPSQDASTTGCPMFPQYKAPSDRPKTWCDAPIPFIALLTLK